jgi:hypothetical protein
MSKSEQARRLRAEHPELSNREIARRCGIAKSTVREAFQTKASPAAEGQSKPDGPLTVFEETGDHAIATVMIPGLKTLDDLLRHMEVDQSVWEVDHHIINKWETGTKHPKTGEVTVTPLFQIKAWLKRKTAQQRGTEDLIKRLEAGSPALPVIKRPKMDKFTEKRSLEICIMDPHIGLLCNYPEADGPWDLELAAGCIMQAIDDLVAKAAPFGPFCEIFMPFGNDFTHADNLMHTTTAGTAQPEAISWHRVFDFAESVAIAMVERLRLVAPVKVYEIPGNHSMITDFTLARILRARFHGDKEVTVYASSSPYKFHRCGCNLIGFEHGHSVKPIRLAALMANECRQDWAETEYREWHRADQHRKGSPTIEFEEQGVSVENVPGITIPNEWHRQKSYSHQQRGAMAYVWGWKSGPIARFQHNLSKYSHVALN